MKTPSAPAKHNSPPRHDSAGPSQHEPPMVPHTTHVVPPLQMAPAPVQTGLGMTPMPTPQQACVTVPHSPSPHDPFTHIPGVRSLPQIPPCGIHVPSTQQPPARQTLAAQHRWPPSPHTSMPPAPPVAPPAPPAPVPIDAAPPTPSPPAPALAIPAVPATPPVPAGIAPAPAP